MNYQDLTEVLVLQLLREGKRGMKCMMRRNEDYSSDFFLMHMVQEERRICQDDTLGAAVLTSTPKKHCSCFHRYMLSNTWIASYRSFFYMFVLSDKHPGISVCSQSTFQGLMHPMKSVWSISQTVDKEIVLQKTNKHTYSCLPQSSW